MEIVIGGYYANDNAEFERKETNVIHVLDQNDDGINNSYISETMFLLDNKVESFHSIDWLPEFLRREATKEEIELFKKHIQQESKLQNWSETVTK